MPPPPSVAPRRVVLSGPTSIHPLLLPLRAQFPRLVLLIRRCSFNPRRPPHDNFSPLSTTSEISFLPICRPLAGPRPNPGSRPGFVPGLRHRLPVARQPLALPQGLNVCPRRASQPPRAARLGETRPPRLISASHTHLDGAVKHCADVASRTRAPLLFSGLAIRTRSGLTRNSVPSRGMHRRPGCSHCGGRRG